MSSFGADPTYPLFPIFAFLGFFLVLIPLPWHFQAWNAGTCLYMIWAAVASLNQFINSVVWYNNALNPAPVWCDISSRIVVASSVAIPAASLCINRRLYKIASIQVIGISKAQKRRAVYEDVAIALGIPLIEIALHYVVNGHRFDIYGNIGCWPATVNVWLTYPLVIAVPIMIGLCSAVYCVLTLRAFYRRRKQFDEVLASTNSGITMNRYFRLMALATTELLCTTPFASYIMYLDLTEEPVSPYRGWADLHWGYSRVDQIPSVLWEQDPKEVVALQMSRWLVVLTGFVFFAFFGFADEARKNYRAVFWAIAKRLGFSGPKPTNNQAWNSQGFAAGSSSAYPRPPKVPKRDSMAFSIAFDKDELSSSSSLHAPSSVEEKAPEAKLHVDEIV